MNSLTMRCMIAAAALAVAAGSAMAQTLKAEIPFTFRAAGAAMGPGTYVLTTDTSSGHTRFLMRNSDTHKGIILVQYTVGDATKAQRAAGVSKLSFECWGLDNCELRELYRDGDRGAYRFRGPKRHEEGRIAEIALTGAKSE